MFLIKTNELKEKLNAVLIKDADKLVFGVKEINKFYSKRLGKNIYNIIDNNNSIITLTPNNINSEKLDNLYIIKEISKYIDVSEWDEEDNILDIEKIVSELYDICKRMNISIPIYKILTSFQIEDREETDLFDLEDEFVLSSKYLKSINLEYEVWTTSEDENNMIKEIISKYDYSDCYDNITIENISIEDYKNLKSILRYKCSGDQLFYLQCTFDIKDYKNL